MDKPTNTPKNWDDFTPIDDSGKPLPKPSNTSASTNWDDFKPIDDSASRGFGGWARDIGATAIKGAIAVPEMVVGLADIPTGGRVGKFLENEGGAVGFRPKEAKELVNDWHSDATKEAQRKFQEADGFWEKAATAVQNPSLIATAVGESIPSMLAGGALGRGALATARGLGFAATPSATAAGAALAAKQATIAGAAGEGLSMAGSAAEQIRQETEDGLLTPMQSGAALLTGVAGGVISRVSGGLQNRLGIGDADTMAVQGLGKAASPGAASVVNPLVQQAAARSIPNQVVLGAINEGLLEELPQSLAEQMLQNVALGKPWHQDLDAAAIMGTLSGGVMGAGAAGFGAWRNSGAPEPVDPGSLSPKNAADYGNIIDSGIKPELQQQYRELLATAQDESLHPRARADAAQALHSTFAPEALPKKPATEALRAEYEARLADLQAQEQGEAPVRQSVPPDGRAVIEARRNAEMAAGRANLGPDDEIYQSTGATDPVRQMVKQAADAGGALSSAAVVAIDTGAAGQMQQAADQAQAQAVAQEQAKAGKKADPAAKVDASTGEIAGGAMASWSDDQLSSAFRGAQDRKVRIQIANELQRRRTEREQADLQAELQAEQAALDLPDAPDSAFASVSEDAGDFTADPVFDGMATTPTATKGRTNGPQAAQAQQAGTQPAQPADSQAAGPTVSRSAGQGEAIGQPVRQPGALTNAAPTSNNGAQAAPAPGTQTQAGGEAAAPAGAATEALRAQLREVEDKILRAAPGAMAAGGGDIEAAMKSRKVPVTLKARRKKLQEQLRAAPAAGGMSNDATKFRRDVLEMITRDDGAEVTAEGEAILKQIPRELQAAALEYHSIQKGMEQAREVLDDDQLSDAERDASARLQKLAPKIQELHAAIDALPGKAGSIAKFGPETGTLGIPRSEMPQVPAQSHGGLVKHLNAQGIAHETTTVDAAQLKPTQAEYIPEKVEAAKSAQGDRAVIVSKDGHIIDGHHQAVAAAEQGKTVKAIVLDAPVEQALEAVKNSPSASRPAPQETDAQPAPKKPSRSVLAKLKEQARAEHFATGNVIASYGGGHDRVVSYQPADEQGNWSVTVRAVQKQGDTWVDVPNERERTHSSEPDARELTRGPVGKVEVIAAKQAESTAEAPAATEAGVVTASGQDRFASNKLFTADKVAAARERMKKKLGTFNSGIDPEMIVDGMTVAGAYIEAGVRNFTQYAKAMIDDMGDGVKPYLLSFWEGARNFPGLDAKDMTDPAESKRQFEALVSVESAQEVAPEAVGEVVKKPAKRTKKTGAKGDMTLTQDWGVERIDGYGDEARETGNSTKDAFLKEAKQYLEAVAAEFAAAGFEPHVGRNGKTGKPVGVNESGMAGSGDVVMTMRHPELGVNVYVHVGDTALRGIAPTTDSGIAVMSRTSTAEGDTYANKGQNRWMPVDLSASDLAANILSAARDNMSAQTRATQPKEPSNGNPEQAGRAADQDRAPAPAGERGNAAQPGSAQADSGDMAADQSQDVPAPANAGRAGGDGVRGAAANVGRAGPADQGRNAGDGRTRASRAKSPDAGAGGADSVSDAVQAAGLDLLHGIVTESKFKVRLPDYAGANAVFKKDGDAWSFTARGKDNADVGPLAEMLERAKLFLQSERDGTAKDPETVSPANPGPGNFHIDNPLEIVGGGQVARFDKNQAAIELLNAIREQGRQATAEEQRTLAGYTGWGSFGQELFQGTWEKPMPKSGWEARDRWLRDHLGQEEWASAQRSITNAHYTDPPTVMAMWDMVKRMGFTGGRVLEPSMGIGNFFGMMPADLKGRSQLAGIELDGLTGAMAKLLYPDANVKVMGYQESKTPDNFYDVVIGNWPFENTPVADRRYNTLNPFLHDYFFLKAMDQVRPGGLVVGITSNGTMDKKATKIRAALARKAELVTSIRLPSGAFQEYAGTKVVTDIVILKKREQPLSITPDEPWINSVAYKTPAGPEVFINEFYVKNPGNVIGTTDFGHGTTRMQPGMIVHRPDNMAERLRAAVNIVPEGVFSREERAKHLTYITNHTADREGSLTEQDGKLFVVRGEHLAPAQEVVKYEVKSAKTTASREAQMRGLIDMRRKYAALIEAERAGAADGARKALRDAYEAFNSEHGDLADSFGLDYLRRIDDPFYPALAALTVNGKPSAILTESTMRGGKAIANPSPQDAYVLARNKSVQPTLAEIAAIASKPEAEVRDTLVKSGAVFEAPNGDVVPSDIYLSGNVRQKLREARAALEDGNKAMERNVSELQKVVPADIPYFNIESQLGATWVPSKAYADYVAHMLNRPSSEGIEATFINGRWKIRLPEGANHWPEARTGFGTAEYPFSKLVNAAFTNQTVKIRRKDSDGAEYVDTEATAEANARIGEIRGRFAEWLWSDPERRAALETEYNEVRNAYSTPRYDGSFLSFEGMALDLGRGPFNLRQHQANAIWRALVNRRSINAHEVGTGKTFTMGGIAVESRRYGIAKKPVILAHNANSASVAHEIQMMYPAAKVLYIDNLAADSIAIKMRQIANDDWDAIVLPHSLIDRLSFREETLMGMAQEDIRSLEEEAYAAADEDGVTLEKEMLEDEEELKKLRSVTAKELVKARNRIIETIKKQAQRSSREGAIPFEDLGIDMVLVDEVHEFKKPPISTRMNMKGLNTQTSDRSIALQFITRYVRANNFGGNVHTFTGTPITNTLTEIFHQMRYVMEDEMREAGVETWDGWFGSFAKELQDVELSAAGEYETITRLAGFINVPELRRMIGQYMDVVFADDMPEMQPREVGGKKLTDDGLSEEERAHLLNGRTEDAKDRPYKKVINVTSDLTPAQTRIFAELQGYARAWRNMTGKQRKEAMSNGAPESPIITEGMANKASFDVRLTEDERWAGMEGKTQDDPGSKASKVVANVLEVYQSDERAAQVIFSDVGYSTSQKRAAGRNAAGDKLYKTVKTFSTMRDIVERLVQGGIPREQIAIVDGSTSKEKRKEIADAVNNLRIRVVIGSTDTLGVGVNMQRNLRAMHHMDAPYMPGELEQRNGRGLRQGNQWNTVLEYRYMTDRLDGRRWQILAIKQRFINAFMKANSDSRVIEGDAASDEESDVLQSFSEAAGDPRILIREKLRKNVEALQRAERMHGNGVADARRTLRNTREAIEWNRGQLRAMKGNGLPERIRSTLIEQADAFEMTVRGQKFDTRKDAEVALDKFLNAEMRMGSKDVEVGDYRGLPIIAEWGSLMTQPELTINADSQAFSSSSLRGIEQQMRNYPQRIEKVEADITRREASIDRLEEVSNAPFARAKDLAAAVKRLADLEKDIEINPVPPPAWLRAGAPVDSAGYRDGSEFVVTGHRWTADGWFVLGQDAKGEMAIPYAQVTDAQGMPLYEEREFQAPEVIEKEAKAADASAAKPGPAGGVDAFRTTRAPGSTQAQLSLDAVQKSVEAALRRVADAPAVKVVRRPEDIGLVNPFTSVPKGLTFPDGSIVVFSDGAESAVDVLRTVFHELFHRGSKVRFERNADYITKMLTIAAGDETVRAEVAAWKRSEDGQDKLAEYREKGPMTGERLANYEALAVEEALATMAERIGTTEPGLVKRVARFLARVADAWGMTQLGHWMRNQTTSETEKFVMETIAMSGGKVNPFSTALLFNTSQSTDTKELADLFKALEAPRGLKLTQAYRAVDQHPLSAKIREVESNFLDILERLDDSGLVQINC